MPEPKLVQPDMTALFKETERRKVVHEKAMRDRAEWAETRRARKAKVKP